MADDEMKNEIEALRAQVAELMAERKAKEKEQAQARSSKASAKESKESVEQDTQWLDRLKWRVKYCTWRVNLV